MAPPNCLPSFQQSASRDFYCVRVSFPFCQNVALFATYIYFFRLLLTCSLCSRTEDLYICRVSSPSYCLCACAVCPPAFCCRGPPKASPEKAPVSLLTTIGAALFLYALFHFLCEARCSLALKSGAFCNVFFGVFVGQGSCSRHKVWFPSVGVEE